MPRVASVQMDVHYGDRDGNTSRIIQHLHSLKDQGVELAVFPECALGGYCVSEREQCQDIALDRLSSYHVRIQMAVDETGVSAVFGFAESDGDKYFNTAALMVPNEVPRFYRKTHLPELGYDNFVRPGDELPVFDTKLGRVGVIICFDIRSPEAARVLALEGADIICIPTNWPKGAAISADVIAPARAAENKVYVVTANRVGEENGFSFIGKSKIIDPFGVVLEQAEVEEKVLISDLDFALSRNKRVVTIPGKHETTVFECRRPELYAPILGHTVPITDKTL